MNIRSRVGSFLLLGAVIGVGAGLAAWKYLAVRQAMGAAANQPEPMEAVTVAIAGEREHRRTTTAIGTVLALQSITLRNEIPGTVHEVKLVPGQIVEAGALLVAMDVSVEEAELKAQEAQAALAETTLRRTQRLSETKAVPEMDLDRAKAERDIAVAQTARLKAVIARKTIRAPFRARVGIADIHPGQFLDEGTQITTLQGVNDAAHVDFSVPQQVAATLRVGGTVEVLPGAGSAAITANIVAIDARVDAATRNAMIRAKIEGAAAPAPGASVRVRVPVGPPRRAVSVPVSALRRGPAGDHVFVVAPGKDGKPRAQVRPVQSGAMLGDEVLVLDGLSPGEQVAASGAFKLRESVLVAVATNTAAGGTQPEQAPVADAGTNGAN